MVVETKDTWYVYRVTEREIVQPTQVSTIAPTPDGPMSGPATGRYMTLTTCHPKYSNRLRLVVHARLGDQLSKADPSTRPPI